VNFVFLNGDYLNYSQIIPDAIVYFVPGTAVRIISDVRRDAPAGKYSVEGRVERVERLEGVERVWVQVEDAAEERRSSSLI